MNCSSTILNGIPLDCGNMGGVKKLWLIDVSDVVFEVSGNDIINLKLFADKKPTQYSFRQGNASFTSNINADIKQNTVYFKTDISIQFNKMDYDKRAEILNIINSNVYAFVEDFNGTFWLIGADSIVSVESGMGQTGSGKGDANMFSLVLTSETPKLPYMIPREVFTSLDNDYYTISGGIISDDETLFTLQVNSDKVGYIQLPKSQILSTSNGLLTSIYTGTPGVFICYIQPSTSSTSLTTTATGDLIFDGYGLLTLDYSTQINSIVANSVVGLNASYCNAIKTIEANETISLVARNNANLESIDTSAVEISIPNNPKLTTLIVDEPSTIAAGGCALTAKSIGDIIYETYINARTNIVYNFTGGTSASVPGGLDQYLLDTYSISFNNVSVGIEENGGLLMVNE